MRLTREAVSPGTRVTLAGLVVGAAIMLPIAASAQPTPNPAPSGQPGATTTVDIKDPKAKAPAAAPKEGPVNVPKKIVNDRDPFINMSSSSGSSTITKTADGGKTLVKKGKKGDKDAPKEAKQEIEVPPPDVTVQGILLSHTGNRAILSSPKQTYMVRQGDKLGDYKVASVAEKTVVFSFKDKTFKLKLKDEFSANAGAPKAGSGGKK